MLIFLTAAIVLQLILFHVDEYYYHRKRGLSRPEIVSALLDGFFYLLPLVIAIFTPFIFAWKVLYIILSLISCLSIIKNELFYPSTMCKWERIVHSSLYVLHPVLLYTFYLSWEINLFHNSMEIWIIQLLYLGMGLRTLAHQLIYWNYIYDKSQYKEDNC